MIPESEHPEAPRFKESGPRRIVPDLFRVLAAVEFDDEAFAHADEVDDVTADAMLASELPAQLMIAQP